MKNEIRYTQDTPIIEREKKTWHGYSYYLALQKEMVKVHKIMPYVLLYKKVINSASKTFHMSLPVLHQSINC